MFVGMAKENITKGIVAETKKEMVVDTQKGFIIQVTSPSNCPLHTFSIVNNDCSIEQCTVSLKTGKIRLCEDPHIFPVNCPLSVEAASPCFLQRLEQETPT